MKSLRLLSVSLCLVVGLLALNGCRNGGSNDALVRLINAAPQTDDLSVSVDGQRAWKHSLFRSNTGFAGVGEGTFQVDMTAQQGGQKRTAENYIEFRKGKAYTVVALSTPRSLQPDLRIFNDDKDAPVPPDKTRMRFMNAAQGLEQVDVLLNNLVGLQQVPYGSRSEAVLLDPGPYDIKVNMAGEVATRIGPVSLRLQPGHSYTLVAMGERAASDPQHSLTLEAYPDDQLPPGGP